MTFPQSTYRLQFGPHLNFAQATTIAPYLADLGVGAVYASPLLQAAPGSTHGYDVTNPTRVSAELGGEQGRLALSTTLRDLGLGLVVDVVPNHMGIAVPKANSWWWDVLRHGAQSAYAGFFDIDWSRGPILLPVLADDGDGGETALQSIFIDRNCLIYEGTEYPLAPGTGQGKASEVHERQHYRLVSWRRGNSELTYRRFFDVTTLAAVRVEDPQVFQATHQELLRWVAEKSVTGLRIDHPDGLADPGGYLQRLHTAAPETWLITEKILGPHEVVPSSWPVHGTTGYDALREICGIFIDPNGQERATRLYHEFADGHTLASIEKSCRRYVANTLLHAEVRRIAKLIPLHTGHDELIVAELLASFPVYRSYLPEGQETLQVAASKAKQALPHHAEAIDALIKHMIAEPHGELATRVQQTSGMVMAKGVEDTAFYRYNRFISLNEVGGTPDQFGVSVADFHNAMARREAAWPLSMTTLSTHDTKRSEDVRARLAVLSEVDYSGRIMDWSQRHPLPESTLTLLAWQTLIGTWPISTERLGSYLIKAAKEAKKVTSWSDPDPEVDHAISSWPTEVMADAELLAEIQEFVTAIIPAGWSNSLGQKLIQLAGPGIPDVYQGTELWDYSLVDPDNRHPIDFDRRVELLKSIDAGRVPVIDDSGGAKLLVTTTILRLRRNRPELFTGYRPLPAEGKAADHVVAFSRGNGKLVAVATRLPVTLARSGSWQDTILPLPGQGRQWRNALTGQEIRGHSPRVADLLSEYPVALVVRT